MISFEFNFLISLPRFIFVDVFICFLEVYNYISSMEDMNQTFKVATLQANDCSSAGEFLEG